jgi:hypothetical protein
VSWRWLLLSSQYEILDGSMRICLPSATQSHYVRRELSKSEHEAMLFTFQLDHGYQANVFNSQVSSSPSLPLERTDALAFHRRGISSSGNNIHDAGSFSLWPRGPLSPQRPAHGSSHMLHRVWPHLRAATMAHALAERPFPFPESGDPSLPRATLTIFPLFQISSKLSDPSVSVHDISLPREEPCSLGCFARRRPASITGSSHELA